jgi:hypothetical protein
MSLAMRANVKNSIGVGRKEANASFDAPANYGSKGSRKRRRAVGIDFTKIDKQGGAKSAFRGQPDQPGVRLMTHAYVRTLGHDEPVEAHNVEEPVAKGPYQRS